MYIYNAKAEDRRKAIIIELGIQHIVPPLIVDRPGGLDDYLFVLFYHSVFIQNQEGRKLYPSKTLFIWSPKQYQYYGSPEHQWNHSWFVCSPRIAKPCLDKAGIKSMCPYSITDPSTFEWYLEAMRRELITQVEPDKNILTNIVSNAAIELGRMIHPKHQKQIVPANFLELRNFIEQNYDKKLTLLELAGQVHFSVPHMCRLFKSYFGTSPMDYLIQTRLRHANRLLSNHNLRIGEIALSVGYSDIYQFSHVFKKCFGISPQKMRTKMS